MAKGRHSKLTPELQKTVCDYLADGCTRRAACGCSGISQDSFARYLAASADFADAITRAEADAEARFTKCIYKAATGYDSDWRAAEAWLKRRRRDEWGDNLSLSRLSDEDVIALATGGVPGVNQAGDTAG